MSGKLIAIEGIDGSGKGTLAGNLADQLRSKGLEIAIHRYPRYETAPFGTLISDYLNGAQFGFDDHPFAVASLYAMDRLSNLPALTALRETHDMVILDRYIGSNIAYQCGRLSADVTDPKALELADWIIDFEVNRLGLPTPELTFYLQTSVELSSELVARKGDRSYTDLTHDKNEADTDLLGAARNWYRWMNASETRLGPWQGLVVTDTENALRPPQDIAADAVTSLHNII